MDDTTVDEWMSFFRNAGIPPIASASYASSFSQNRINFDMVLELNRDLLKELGVTLIGDAIAILRHAKSFHEQNVRRKILDLMSPDCRKHPDVCKELPATDATSITNSKRLNGDICSGDALPVENNLPAIPVAYRNANNQEAVSVRQQTQFTSKENSRHVTASPSHMDNATQSISVGMLQREELQVCEALMPALGEPDTTEERSMPYSASRSQNNIQTSHSDCFLMRGPVEPSSTLPLRQASFPSSLSGGNYICKRTQSLNRPMQQNTCCTIASTSQQPTGRLPYGTPSTPAASQSPMPRIENNTLQDAHDGIVHIQSTKRKRTLSYCGSHEQEMFDPNVCIQSVGERVAKRPAYEIQSTIETVRSEGSKDQEYSELDVGLPRQGVKNNVTATEDPTENHSSLEQRCQLNLQRKQEESRVQVHTRAQSQERLQVSPSLPDKRSQSQIMPGSQLPSHTASSSQFTFLRKSQSHLRYRPELKIQRESQSSLPDQRSEQPQSMHALATQANGCKNLESQNQKETMQCNPPRSCSTTKFMLATGKNKLKKIKLLDSRRRLPYMTSAPHSSECYQANEVRKVRSLAISSCNNKSVAKETDNNEKEEIEQTPLECGNETCVSQNGSETEFIGAGGDLLEEELSSFSSLKTDTPVVRCDTHQLSKPAAHTSDCCVYEDSSSHTFRNSSDDAENNLQRERVPGQIFSRLGVKVEVVSVDNDVFNTAVQNDRLPSCRFGSSVKYKINKSKKNVVPNKFAKVKAVKQISKNKLLKRKIVFTAFKKASTSSKRNIVSDQAPQEVTSIDDGLPKLRGILKSQTSTSNQQEDMEAQKEEQSQKMTANLLLESVTRSGATDIDMVSDTVQIEESSVSNNCTKSEDEDYIYQDADNFCCESEQQEELSRASSSGMSKTVHFGPVRVREFEKTALPISEKMTVFRRLGARRKGI